MSRGRSRDRWSARGGGVDVEEFRAQYGKRGKKPKRKRTGPARDITDHYFDRVGDRLVMRERPAACPSDCEEGWRLFRAFVEAGKALREHREGCGAEKRR